MIKFFRGPAASFNKETHKDGLYFATDKGEIYLNDSVYGSGEIVTDVEMNEDGTELIVYRKGQEAKTINLVELMAEASATGAGLMSAEDKIALDALSTAFENDEFVKVQGIAAGDKILSMTDKLVSATVSLTYDSDTKKIQLLGKDDADLGSVDATPFIKDGMISEVDLVTNPEGQEAGKYIMFKWNTDSGVSEPMYVAVTDLVDVYSKGDGIEIDSNNVIKAKVKTDDAYLEVTTDGIASKGIDDAILLAKNAVVGTTEDAETAVTLYGVKKYAANIVGAHESAVTEALNKKVDVEVYNTFVANTNSTLSNIKVTDVDSTETAGIKLNKTEAGVISVGVDTNTLASNLVGATGVVGPVSGTTIKLGEAITIEKEVDGTPQTVVIGEAGSSVQSVIKTLAGKIETVIASGITAIDGGEYITVGGSDTSKTLTVNVAKIGSYLVDNSSALKVDEDGKIALHWEDVE